MRLFRTLAARFQNLFYPGLSDESVNIFKLLKTPLLTRIPRWIGVLQPDAVKNLFRVDHAEWALLAASAEKLGSSGSTDGIEFCSRFPEAEEFRLSAFPAVGNYTRRTGRYLNWRYFDIPRHNYRSVRNAADGFAIYRIEQIAGQGASFIRILEWNFAGDSAEKALRFIIGNEQRSNPVLLDFFCSAEKVGAELQKLGFIEETGLASRIPYLIRPINYHDGIALGIDLPPHRSERSLDFSDWYLTKGDGDIDRIKL